MSKEIYISSTPHETRLAIVESDELTEIYYERENEYTLAGSIYNGKVTRVLPGMQSSFVDIGLERDAFLYITDFLEEAADSADFDSGEGRGRGESRRGGRDRQPQTIDGQTSYQPAEGSDTGQQPELQGSGLGSGREISGREQAGREQGGREQGGRDAGGRDGDRGRRRRGGNRDRSGSERGGGERSAAGGERSAISNERSGVSEEPNGNLADTTLQAPTFPRVDEIEQPVSFAGDGGQGDLGEGAPGAEGSRRWRGRRGRRRSRGAGAPEETGTPAEFEVTPPAVAQGGAEHETDLVEDAADPSAGYDLPEAPSYAGSLQATTVEPIVSAYDAAPVRDGGREERGGRGRGGRDRSADRGGERVSERGAERGAERGGERRGGRELPRAPRGFAPRHGLYAGADPVPAYEGGTEETATAESAAEPMILPGESIARFRSGGEPAAAASEVVVPQLAAAAAPAAEFSLPGAWDGGNVLPGETIRPRTPRADDEGSASGRSSERSADRSGERSGGRSDGRSGDRSRGRGEGRGRGDGRRDGGRGRDGRGEGRSDSRRDSGNRVDAGARVEGSRRPESATAPVASEPALTPRSVAPEVDRADRPSAPFSDSRDFAGQERSFTAAPVQQQTDGPSIGTPAEARAIVTEAGPQAGDSADYEPTEGSASLRFDPLPPRSFRQPADASQPEEQHASEEAPSSIAHAITPAPGEAMEPIHEAGLEAAGQPGSLAGESFGERHPDFAAGSEGGDPFGHDVTAISPDGDMLSAAPELAPAAEELAPTAPIAHETAVLEHHEAVVEISASSAPAFDTEEFEMDGAGEVDGAAEDFRTTLHAASFEEMEYDEEETLEGAADLGTMLREMSIDQITRPEGEPAEQPSDEDEFAFEEEDSLDDPFFAGQPASATQDEEPGFLAQEPPFDAQEAPLANGDSAREEDRSGLRRGRRDRRGGRERSGNREGARSAEGDRSGRSASDRGDRSSSDRNGSDRTGSDRSSSDRSSSDRTGSDRSSSDRTGYRAGRREGHRSAQVTNLPAISDLLKPGQEVLVQIAKEPIAKKGARITSHIALPGRFLVFMPTVNHTGVSRKIESDGERRRLKEILLSEKGDASGGFIVRTAAAGASEEELRSDLRFLLNLWADIKQRSESSKSPALIYHDLNLVERILRDQVTDNFSAIWVDTETEYERVLRFLQRFQPSLIRRVKLYTKETPLFEQFGLTEEINKALRSKVWLKSGGSIVINQTEALVAIDINTGKYVGKTARLEDTIVKTNLDAIPEIVRQIRLRDLGGIIIIDFIDMDERKNRNRVMAALEEELKKDRAPSKVLQFNDFGLVAITRKRVKQSLERTLSTPCVTCTGTGMVKSPITVCNDIYVEMRKMQKHLDRGDVMLRVNPEVVKQLKSPQSKWLQEMEELVGKTILVKSDPALHPEQFDIH